MLKTISAISFVITFIICALLQAWDGFLIILLISFLIVSFVSQFIEKINNKRSEIIKINNICKLLEIQLPTENIAMLENIKKELTDINEDLIEKANMQSLILSDNIVKKYSKYKDIYEN